MKFSARIKEFIILWCGKSLMGIGALIVSFIILFSMAIFSIKDWYINRCRQNRIKIFAERRAYCANSLIRSPNLALPTLFATQKPKKFSYSMFMSLIGNKQTIVPKPSKEVKSEGFLKQTPAPKNITSVSDLLIEPVVDLSNKSEQEIVITTVSSLTNARPYYLRPPVQGNPIVFKPNETLFKNF